MRRGLSTDKEGVFQAPALAPVSRWERERNGPSQGWGDKCVLEVLWHGQRCSVEGKEAGGRKERLPRTWSQRGSPAAGEETLCAWTAPHYPQLLPLEPPGLLAH